MHAKRIMNHMFSRTAACVLFIGGMSVLFTAPVSSRSLEVVNIKVVIKVPDADRVKSRLTTFAEKQGGYLLRLSPTSLTLSIPASAGVKDVVARVTKDAVVVERTISKNGVGERILDLETSIAVKKKHLANLYKLFARTNFEQTLDLEKEVGRVVASIERKQGELRYLRDRVRNMVVQVSFQTRPPRRAITPVKFAWLARINIESFIRRFTKR